MLEQIGNVDQGKLTLVASPYMQFSCHFQ